MENILQIFGWASANIGTLVAGVLAVLGGFSILAKLTPTDADDKFIQGALNFIHGLGLTKKK